MTTVMEQPVPDGKSNLFIGTGPISMQESNMRLFAERLRSRIAELDLTQSDVARKLRIQERRFSHFLTPRPDTGKFSQPDLYLLVRIAEVLETHPNYLLGVSQEVQRPREASNSRRITDLEDEVVRLRERLDTILDK